MFNQKTRPSEKKKCWTSKRNRCENVGLSHFHVFLPLPWRLGQEGTATLWWPSWKRHRGFAQWGDPWFWRMERQNFMLRKVFWGDFVLLKTNMGFNYQHRGSVSIRAIRASCLALDPFPAQPSLLRPAACPLFLTDHQGRQPLHIAAKSGFAQADLANIPNSTYWIRWNTGMTTEKKKYSQILSYWKKKFLFLRKDNFVEVVWN